MLSLTKSRKAGKTLLQTLFFFLLITQMCFAQWYEQNSGTIKNLYAVTFTDSNNGFAVGDSEIIIKTTDGGTNWITQSSGSVFPLNDVTFVNSSTGWVVGGDDWYSTYDRKQIILATTNGGVTWQLQFNDSIGPLGQLSSVHFINENNGWAVGGGTDGEEKPHFYRAFLRTTNSGISWTSQTEWIDTTGKNGILNAVQFSDQQIGWAVGNHGTIMKTTNGGVNWAPQIQNPEIVLNDVHFIDINNGWAVGGNHFFITTNGGSIWENQLFYDSSMIGGLLNCYDVHFVNPTTGYVVGGWDESRVYGNRLIIFKTIDGGLTWTEQVCQDTLPLFAVNFIDFLTGWAVGANGIILHTTNGGVVPVELTSFTASANGKDVTLSWSTVTELNNQGFEVQRKFGSNDFVTVGSVKGHGTATSPNNYTYVDKLMNAGKYFYRLKQIDYGGKYEYSQTVEVNWSPLTTYKLEQNYPNPFNPTTRIHYSIPSNVKSEMSNVTLKVYDVLGNEMATLVNEEKDAGNYEVEWNAEKLSSGVYFYQLKAGSFIDTRKMILLR